MKYKKTIFGIALIAIGFVLTMNPLFTLLLHALLTDPIYRLHMTGVLITVIGIIFLIIETDSGEM